MDLVFERLHTTIDDSVKGKVRYPKDAIFLAEDLPNLGERLVEAIHAERTVVVVYADGTDKMIVPRRASRTRSYWFRLLCDHLLWRRSHPAR
jgi:hypothetical protein